MTQFPKGITFKYPWRKYQARVLKELDTHLDDNHLHLIAPPGSGKTILGLEVALRLNKPTLVFAPTISIRNQWVQRFTELFLQVDHTPNWISTDIKNPKLLTVTTYQALFAAHKLEQKNEVLQLNSAQTPKLNGQGKLLQILKKQKVGTIIVDEAHHLKNAWWKSLTWLKEALDPTIVGLTATPPYDVSRLEWQRYSLLNGPVDAEISVPELVTEGDLCPHQDFVYFSEPSQEEQLKIKAYKKRMENLFQTVTTDSELLKITENLSFYLAPKLHLEWIYSHIEDYVASLIFLQASGKEISKIHLEIIGNKKTKLPKLNYEWLEIFIHFYLFSDSNFFNSYEIHQEKLTHQLKRNGALSRKTISFKKNKQVNDSLTSSVNKLNSIAEIVKFEHHKLNEDLRMVILTDYIRKEFLVDEPNNDLALNKIGVMPIFEQLRRSKIAPFKIGILSGSLVVIPETALEKLLDYGENLNISIRTKALKYDSNYLVVYVSSPLKNHIVQLLTQLFQEGEIEVLIGTKSLLGEGWDAPAINTLVLASFVGSYVLSNQMRGRAIRSIQGDTKKTGNIWHLVSLDMDSFDGGEDLQLLKRRFKAFVGVSFKRKAQIENGIERLNLPYFIKTNEALNQINQLMLEQAGQRVALKEKWKKALATGTILIEAFKITFPKEKNYTETKYLYYNRTLAYLFGMLSSGLVGFGYETLLGLFKSLTNFHTNADIISWLTYIGGVGFFTFGGFAYHSLKSYIKYRDIAKDIHHIGEALLASLIETRAILSAPAKLRVASSIDDDGAVYCRLVGGTTYEKSLFLTALLETIGLVDNPRYIMIRKSLFLNKFKQLDYHAVPEILGQHKKQALVFEKHWKKFVGRCELVFTRTIEGRKLLLKSRIESLAAVFEKRTSRVNKWKK